MVAVGWKRSRKANTGILFFELEYKIHTHTHTPLNFYFCEHIMYSMLLTIFVEANVRDRGGVENR